MIRKLGAENKRDMTKNILLEIGSYRSETNYLQMP
jgi:hypothetical protein